MTIHIGIDIGGTFTDIAAIETTSGTIHVTKVATTSSRLSTGFFSSLDKILAMTNVSFGEIERLVHGTTIATNAILEQRGARIGVLTTRGFEDVLIMGRGWRSSTYEVFYDSETPTFLIERRRIRGIEERLDSKGDILIPLKESSVLEAADCLVKQHGVESIAVCYLFSYVNPTHEQRTEQIIRDRYPNINVSLSSVVNPRYREYERIVITAFNAYIGPKMEKYIQELQEGLNRRQIDVKLQVMQSRGGITSAEMCIEKPVVTLLSGPAGGVSGGIFFGHVRGVDNLITMDMGGTSCDVSIVPHGRAFLSIDGKIGKYPLRQAMMDVSTIGAGGSSIAWVDSAGGLKIGPMSAGADPGPACYGRGGKLPTVTDASLILGYLNPQYFAGGELTLQPELANEAIQNGVARPLGMKISEAAAGIHRVVNNMMADQLRLVSVKRGYDPRNFSLIAFGGAGPIAAGRVAKQVGICEVIVPVSPGVLSAFGLLVADIEHEEVATFIAKTTEVSPKDIARVLNGLREACERKRKGVGISLTKLQIRISAEMRYIGQSYELEVPFPEGEGEIIHDTIRKVTERFHEVHQNVYQHSIPTLPVEFVAFRVVYSQEPALIPKLNKLDANLRKEISPKSRQAYFDEYHGFVDTRVYDRATLAVGQKLAGPAVIEQADTTTVIYPNQVAEVDEWGNLLFKVV